MNRVTCIALIGLVAAMAFPAVGCETTPKTTPSHVKRVGMVVELRPETMAEYKRIHADDHPGVRDLLVKYNLRNLNIFLHKMPDGKWYEFGYYEYTGKDFDADMAALGKEPRNIEWLKMCDPMQKPLPGSKGWTEMERIYFNN